MSNNTLPETIADAAQQLRDGSLTSDALTRACLARIEALQPRLNAFITITAEPALRAAAERDDELKRGRQRGPLHGIPVVFKDCFDTAGVRTTVGSGFMRERIPTSDAAVVRRLHDAGVVALGKTNMNEFAAGTSGVNAFFGDTHNPWDIARSPGGSSSGTAVAIASGMCLGGVGSDGGGSIRIPAAWCGLVGIRPTIGRVSTAGGHPRTYSFDCVGPLARTVRDCALLLQAMAGHDAADPRSLADSVPDYARDLTASVAGLRIGVIDDFSRRGLDAETATAFDAAIQTLTRRGAQIKTIQIPPLTAGFEYAALFDIMLYEFNQILGEQYRACADRATLFGPMVQSNLARGVQIDGKYYQRALAERPARVAQIRQAFAEVDALITPVTPMLPPLLSAAPAMFDQGRQFMLPFSFAGLPAISLPCGASAAGLPIGIQLVADRQQEGLLFRIAAAFEAETPFHRRRPPG